MNRDMGSLVAVVLVAACSQAEASEFRLADEGRALAQVYAPGENQWAGHRLVDRVERFTGVRLRLQTADAVPTGEDVLVAVGTPESNPVVRAILESDDRVDDLGEQGYLLKVGQWDGRRVLVCTGGTLDGVHHAVSELVSWRLQLASGRAWVPETLDISEKPALKYRLLWNWDSRTNWDTSIERMHSTHFQRYNLNEQGEVGFLTHFKRAIDFYSDHKLNGLIIWGFIRDQHGGMGSARELSRYARQNNVRILPGVCTEAAYGGFLYSDKSRFNLDVWTQKHPHLRFMNTQGEFIPGICPARPENQQWLREGTEWFFEQLPDVGGMNLENGDWFYCWTDDCIEAKSRSENDPNFFWDMMASQRPVLETAQRVRPDAWMTFASYTGFTEAAIRGAMDGAVKTRRATGIATEVVYPPRFLNQVPENGICQWTLTGMAGPHAWPEDARPPAGSFTDHIGYIHQGGSISAPANPERWWAGPPGAGWDDVSDVIQFVCSRVHRSGMAGLGIYGERGAVSPANELNYLAFEYFSWKPESTWDDFVDDRLTLAYGGRERAELFLKLLRSTTRDAADIGQAQKQAEGIAAQPELDVRQSTRWRHLADELARRARLAAELVS